VRAAFALLRASWLSASSYKVSTILSLVGIAAAVVPIYFIARALEPFMADVIRGEGHQYFGFLLVGAVTFWFLRVAVRSLPSLIGSSIGNGTLEAMLTTPTPVPVVLGGMMSYGFSWTALRGLVFLTAGWMLGAAINWERVPIAVLIVVLIILAHVSIGLMGAAAVLAFRTPGPLPQAILIASALLGGVYYPTKVVPSWLEHLSALLPLTYGLRALRRVLLDGMPLAAVSVDVGILMLFTAVLLALGASAFSRALRYARRNGSLSHY
jgi:ABC-2 type transport system permease protein